MTLKRGQYKIKATQRAYDCYANEKCARTVHVFTEIDPERLHFEIQNSVWATNKNKGLISIKTAASAGKKWLTEQ